MNMKKLTSAVMAGIFALGVGFTTFSAADVEAAAKDSPQCTAVDRTVPEGGFFFDFAKKLPKEAEVSDGWTNGAMFDANWHRENVEFEGKKMALIIDEEMGPGWSDPTVKYTGGEFRTKNKYHYGLYEVCMKPIKNDGVVSSYFTYTGPYDQPPTIWDEIDIEILGKDTTKAQFNYFTDSKGGHEYLCDLGFDASEAFHVYGFDWQPDSITWYVDGQAVYTVHDGPGVDKIPVTPSKLMANAWAGRGVDAWLNAFDDSDLPIQAEYKWMKFTPSEAQ